MPAASMVRDLRLRLSSRVANDFSYSQQVYRESETLFVSIFCRRCSCFFFGFVVSVLLLICVAFWVNTSRKRCRPRIGDALAFPPLPQHIFLSSLLMLRGDSLALLSSSLCCEYLGRVFQPYVPLQDEDCASSTSTSVGVSCARTSDTRYAFFWGVQLQIVRET